MTAILQFCAVILKESFAMNIQTRSQSLLICSSKAMKDWGRNDAF